MTNPKGLRQQIKDGETSPEEALKQIRHDPNPSPFFLQWVNSTGKRRYEQALKAKEKTPEPKVESKPVVNKRKFRKS